MKYGIYYAFWEHKWGGEYLPYISKVKRLGFDCLEISAASFPETSLAEMGQLKQEAQDQGILLTAGYGPKFDEDVASADPAIVENALKMYRGMFEKMEAAGIKYIGGALYTYWPTDYSKPVDKPAARARAVEGTAKAARLAKEYGITMGLEVMNRFEGYLINTAQECVDFIKDVGQENVKVMLDTFHMNIEEDGFAEAIHTAGDLLGHLHVGETNRRLPGQGRMPWGEIAKALKEIGYDGNVVMEPFIMDGGQIGEEVKVWRDLSNGATVQELDQMAADSVKFLRKTFEA